LIEGGDNVWVEAPWRIIASGAIAATGDDHGQLFGRRRPMDGEAEASHLFSGRAIASIDIDRETSDLAVCFAGDVRFEVFNNSTGYEPWTARFGWNGEMVTLVATGGGGLPGGAARAGVAIEPEARAGHLGNQSRSALIFRP
jgi:hypothetical protein